MEIAILTILRLTFNAIIVSVMNETRVSCTKTNIRIRIKSACIED